MIERFATVVLFVSVSSIWLVPFSVPDVRVPSLAVGSIEEEFEGGDILFVGDIMLGRHVETLAREHGPVYPFLNVRNLLTSSDVTIGNFEGSVPKVHKQTPDNVLRFSVQENFFKILHENGFDALSLANNHSFDFGEGGYLHTKNSCEEYGLLCGGHPYSVVDSSIAHFEVGDVNVGVVFLHQIAFDLDDAAFLRILNELLESADLQVAFVHWGEEYQHTHSAAQEELAHFLIDRGIDAVIGHHPHVVQDIEVYKEKPIFYSLGNFIFDQYFSDEVQNGLGIRMQIEKDRVEYTLVPLTSVGSVSQPRIMTIDEKNDFLARLAAPDVQLAASPFVFMR